MELRTEVYLMLQKHKISESAICLPLIDIVLVSDEDTGKGVRGDSTIISHVYKPASAMSNGSIVKGRSTKSSPWAVMFDPSGSVHTAVSVPCTDGIVDELQLSTSGSPTTGGSGTLSVSTAGTSSSTIANSIQYSVTNIIISYRDRF